LARERLGTAMAAGIRYVAMSPNIRVVLLRASLFGIAASAISALLPLVARHVLGGGPLTYGILLGAFGAGAVGGAFLTTWLRHILSIEHLVQWSSVIFGTAAIVAGISPFLPLSMVALALAGAGWVQALSTFNVTVQMSAPRWVVGRALALYQMAAFGGMAAGSWIWGVVAEETSVAIALIASGIAQLAVIAVGMRVPLPDAEALNLDPLRPFAAPDTAVPVEPRSGPVVVTIEYLIAEEDIVAFLAAMAERRRIRLRDGARHWTLLRDLQKPMLWVERYHTPTWLDYVRHNQRITQADADVGRRLRALHRGDTPPIVHRRIERQTGSLPIGRAPGPREMAEPLTDPTRST
ncbi:MAG TPA: MFS transporter, partial [Sphingomonadaceae bacterium]|nr:MFS transporter [Sphingomonadaceae bacterium]